MNENKTELGKLLKGLREKAFPGEGLRRVAVKVEIDYAHLFRLEVGQYVPSDENLNKLLSAYGAEPREKVEAFNLARLSPSHAEAMEEVYRAHGIDAALAGAFFRREKEEDDKQHDK